MGSGLSWEDNTGSCSFIKPCVSLPSTQWHRETQASGFFPTTLRFTQ